MNARAEDYGGECGREGYDIVVSRAVAQLRLLVELGLPLLRTGGVLLAMKGPLAHQELGDATSAISQLGGHVVGIDGQGPASVVTISKRTHTPKTYPRSWGEMKRRPLCHVRCAARRVRYRYRTAPAPGGELRASSRYLSNRPQRQGECSTVCMQSAYQL